MLDNLAHNPSIEVLEPRGLSASAVARAITGALGEPEDAFTAACARVTGGNPFLLGELLRELATVAPTAANAALVERQTSRTVSRSALARLRRLPPAATALARAVVILGDGAEPALAAALAEIDADTASRAADALEEAAILTSEPRPGHGRRLSFVHPLVRESVYAELSAGDRARGHARAAQLLTAAGADAERVAIHRHEGDPAGDPEAVRVLREAAASARRRGATEVALSHLRRALREPPTPRRSGGQARAGRGRAAVGAVRRRRRAPRGRRGGRSGGRGRARRGAAAGQSPGRVGRGAVAGDRRARRRPAGARAAAAGHARRRLAGQPRGGGARARGRASASARTSTTRARPASGCSWPAWPTARRCAATRPGARARPAHARAARRPRPRRPRRLRHPARAAVQRRAGRGHARVHAAARLGPRARLVPLVRAGLAPARGRLVAAREPGRGRGRRRELRRAPELHGPPGRARAGRDPAVQDDVEGAERLWHDLGLEQDPMSGRASVATRQTRARVRAATGRHEEALREFTGEPRDGGRVGHPHARALHVALGRRPPAHDARPHRGGAVAGRGGRARERAASAIRARSGSRCAPRGWRPRTSNA